MTAIAAISTSKFSVIASDSYASEEANGFHHHTQKLFKLDSGIVVGHAGNMGPIIRRVISDSKWKTIKTLDDFHNSVVVLANDIIEKEQFNSEAEINPEELLVCSHDDFMIVDNDGSRVSGYSLKTSHGSDLQVKVGCAGSGKSFIHGYILGFINSMSDKDKKSFFRGSQRVAELLKDSINFCSKYQAGIGGDIQIEIIKLTE